MESGTPQNEQPEGRLVRKTIEVAWLAGVLEGEGTFGLVQNKRSSGPPHPVVRCTMSDRDIVERVARAFGGKAVVFVQKSHRNPKHSDMWTTAIQGWPAIDLLRKIRPYMGERRGHKIDEILNSPYTRVARRGPGGKRKVAA